MPGLRTRVGWAAAGGAAAAIVMLGMPAVAATPQQAIVLVRQALAALEVTPPDLGVATERTIKALFAADSRGVDMPRVRDAAQALGQEDAVAAAGYLMAALRPAEGAGSGIDPALLTPVQLRFAATPAAYGLLLGAVLLIGAGVLILR